MTQPAPQSTRLPSLSGWEQSAPSLHKAAQLLGAIRMLVRERVPNYLELALRIEPSGLSTDVLPSGGTIVLDFVRAALLITSKSASATSIALTDHTQASLLETLLSTLDQQSQGLTPQQDGSYSKGFLTALHAKHHMLEGSLTLTSNEPLYVDPKVSAEYIQALYRIFTATARWRARLVGQQTPIVVWPEHFDLSTLWFVGEPDDHGPHINFGFAPFDSVHPRPYLYAYAYPMPDGFEQLPLPSPAQWHTAPWKGVYVPYDELAQSDGPEALIEQLFEQIYTVLSPSLLGESDEYPTSTPTD